MRNSFFSAFILTAALSKGLTKLVKNAVEKEKDYREKTKGMNQSDKKYSEMYRNTFGTAPQNNTENTQNKPSGTTAPDNAYASHMNKPPVSDSTEIKQNNSVNSENKSTGTTETVNAYAGHTNKPPVSASVRTNTSSNKSSNENDDFHVVTPEDIYAPDKITYTKAEVEKISITEKEAVALGYSFRKKSKKRAAITKYRGSNDDLIVPYMIGDNIVNEIAACAFEKNKGIKNISIPDSVKKLGKCAFLGSSIERCIISEGIRKISDSAFFNCEKLRDIHLPHSLVSIGDSAFRGCKELKYIKFNSLRNYWYYLDLGNFAFAYSGLEGFGISKYAKVRNGNAFRGTPLEKKYPVILEECDRSFMRIVCIGSKYNKLRFRSSISVLSIGKGALSNKMQLDFSQCGSLWIDHNAFGSYNSTLIFNSRQLTPEIVFRIPTQNKIMLNSGKIIEKKDYSVREGNCEYFTFDSGSVMISKLESKAEKVFIEFKSIHNPHPFSDAEFYFPNASEVTVNKEIFCTAPLMRTNEIYNDYYLLCRLRKITWNEYKKGDVTKYLPIRLAKEGIIRAWVGVRLQSALVTVDRPLPRIYGKRRHSHERFFFDSSVIDKLFTETDKHKQPILRQREKILIAIDVLRSTQRECDTDTSIYDEYLRQHFRYAKIVCYRIKDKFPDYFEFLQKYFPPENHYYPREML